MEERWGKQKENHTCLRKFRKHQNSYNVLKHFYRPIRTFGNLEIPHCHPSPWKLQENLFHIRLQSLHMSLYSGLKFSHYYSSTFLNTWFFWYLHLLFAWTEAYYQSTVHMIDHLMDYLIDYLMEMYYKLAQQVACQVKKSTTLETNPLHYRLAIEPLLR